MDNPLSSKSVGLPGRGARWGRLWRYAAAVVAVGLAVAARWALSGILGHAALFLTFYPAVALTGMIAGGRAGLLATVLSAAATDWLFLEPRYSLGVHSLGDMVSLGFFTIAGVLMSIMAGMVGRAQQREWQAVERQKAAEEVQRSEAAARERAAELAAIMDAMPILTLIAHDREARRITSNRAGYELLRLPYGVNISRSAPPGERLKTFRVLKDGRELRPEEMPAQQAAATSREVRDFEMRVVFQDGTWRDIYGNAVPLLDTSGQPRGAVGAFMDITERRRLERELRASERKFRALFDNAKDAILVLDLKGRFLDVNREACERLGYSREELLQMGPREIDSPEFAAKVSARMGELIRDGHILFESEHQRRDGTRMQVEINSTLLELEGATLAFSTCRDITARKRAEEALRRAEARLAQAVQVAELGIFEHDHRSDVIEYSPAMRKLLGFGEEEKITIEGILQRLVPEDREAVAATMRRAHDPAGDGRFVVEFRVAQSDGRIRWMSARSQTFFEGEGSERRPARTIGAALDVTERKEVEAGLERLVAERTARLQETVAELEHFSYTITHDMRAPLRAMQGFGGVLLRECADCLHPRRQDLIRRIAQSAERMDSLITDALNYSKVVREQLELGPVDAGALLRGMIESYPQFQPPRAEVEIAGTIPMVLGNPAGLTQCFSNLLGNAVKFVHPGTVPKVRVWAEPRSQEESVQSPPPTVPSSGIENQKSKIENAIVRIWFEDNGIGIAREHQDVIFTMFQRLSKSYEGTGIGLALARKVVERMKGAVGVESEEGRGSRFWVELPRCEGGYLNYEPGRDPVCGG